MIKKAAALSAIVVTITACADVRYATTPEVMHNAKTNHITECKGSAITLQSAGLLGAQAEKDGCIEKYESLGYVRVISEAEMAKRREWH